MFFNDTATTEIYTLSLHDALPISVLPGMVENGSGVIINISSVNALGYYGNEAYSAAKAGILSLTRSLAVRYGPSRSEEHTSELQSRQYLVCRLLLEKKHTQHHHYY